jgi:hypothetical protein
MPLTLDREQAIFIPLREDYLEHCIDMVPTAMPEDPGENAFGTGATPPFLLRPGGDDLVPASRNRSLTENCQDRSRVFRQPGDISVCRWPRTNPFPILKAPC